MANEFIILDGVGGGDALIRVSTIVAVMQDPEYQDRRVIQYVAGDKLLTMHVQDSIEKIAEYIALWR